jgi:hypothetical protein
MHDLPPFVPSILAAFILAIEPGLIRRVGV